MLPQEFYGTVYQQPLLLAVPTFFWLAWLVTQKHPHPLRGYCLAFALLSILDAWLTANTILGFGSLSGLAATVIPVFFVILGDFRVFLLLVRRHWIKALGLSLIVPVGSALVMKVLPETWSALPRVTYLVYELMLLALLASIAIVQKARGAQSLQVKQLTAYAATYYALWIVADVWIISGLPGEQLAWSTRIGANLLYYVGWTPWVFMSGVNIAFSKTHEKIFDAGDGETGR